MMMREIRPGTMAAIAQPLHVICVSVAFAASSTDSGFPAIAVMNIAQVMAFA